jgi:hypothetical protein
MNKERRTAERRVTPAVGEFAVQERAQLLARVDEQAREIGRLKANLDECDGGRWELRAALSALKAQPSGVALPGLATAVLDAFASFERYGADCFFENNPMIQASILEELAELARLNSSPVSDGAVDERAAFEAHMRIGGYSNPDKHPDGSYVSSAMELWWQGWKARAQMPSQGGEAVATDAFVPGSLADLLFQLGEKGIQVSGGTHSDHWRVTPLYTHPADQVAEGGQHARDSEELRSLCAARDQYRDLSIKYGDKLSEALQLLTRCQEHLDPHRDAALWSDVCAALGPKP